MDVNKRATLSAIIGALVLGFLVVVSLLNPPALPDPVVWVIFVFMITFASIFGVPWGGGLVSILPMVLMTSCLVVGIIPTAWAAVTSVVFYIITRQNFSSQVNLRRLPTWFDVIGVSMANQAILVLSVMASGTVYLQLGGTIPLRHAYIRDSGLFFALVVAYLLVNYATAGLFISLRDRSILTNYLRSLPTGVVYEALPMMFTPLIAIIYARLGLGMFIIMCILVVVSSLFSHFLARAIQRLRRRVRELDSLQAVGQALSASLDLNTILDAVYTQVSALMPTRNFYVALYDPERDEVTFPLAYDDGQRDQLWARRAGNGITEYVLRSGKPLLAQADMDKIMQREGVTLFGRQSLSWLGVPIMAGDQRLGVIAVQSYDRPGVYDESHRDVLVTIAAQAAVAIQNARLYTRTDEALAERVQELNSILRTSNEGILLLSLNGSVVAANRTLADFLAVSQTDLESASFENILPGNDAKLMASLGYSRETWSESCSRFNDRGAESQKQSVVLFGPPQRTVERSLTPVRDRSGGITGWLIVLRDRTEEVELERIKDDMTHMLVHDLRSPLTTLMSGMEMLRLSLGDLRSEEVNYLLNLIQRGGTRLLGMINELLDINRMEQGQLTLHREPVDVEKLLQDVVAQLDPLAQDAQINVSIDVAPGVASLSLDPEKTRRVFNNLLDNAIKFTPNGGSICLWACNDLDARPPAVLIGVKDTGPGIPLEAQHRLFKKFQRITEIEGRRIGTGLGLSFCKLVAEAHGGEIKVESRDGQGSNFIVRFPTS